MKSYSVDRVESRRQRRIHKLIKDTGSNHKPTYYQKRAMNEGRHDKKIMARNRSQMQIPPFFLKSNSNIQNHPHFKLKEMLTSKNSIRHLKHSSMKSANIEINIFSNKSSPFHCKNTSGDHNSIISTGIQSLTKESEEN